MTKNSLSSIVVSSRIRLARNLAQAKFARKIDAVQQVAVMKKVIFALDSVFPHKVYSIANLSSIDTGVMLEKHLISPNLARNKESGAVVLSLDESISIMINEEDHLRAQCILPGLCLDKACETLMEIDDKLNNSLDFAFDTNLGFLTSCVSNLGTAMRASVMMFLPALSIAGKIGKVTEGIQKLGLSIRGAFGEESDTIGYMFQISNTSSLGKSENEIVNSVTDAVKRIIELEKEERIKLLDENLIRTKDLILRAYAILTGAFSISENEFSEMIAKVKLGVAFGFLKFRDNEIVDKIVFQCLPASLSKIAGKEMTREEEDLFRAEFLAKALKQNRIA